MVNNFKALKRKIFTWAILVIIIAMVIGFILQFVLVDGILQAPFARAFVSFCEIILGLDDERARNIYNIVFVYSKSTWLTLGLLVILLIVFYNSLSRFTKYFNEVTHGVDALMNESPSQIELSPELDFMEKKLNFVKRALEKRSRDAKEAENRKNDLVVYLAHDIRTPLTSIIGYLSLLSEVEEMPLEQRVKYINITLEKANRLETLIDEFFEITRFNLHEIVLNKDNINLNHMLIQLADEFYPIAEPKNIKIEVMTNEDTIEIYADSDKLARVFNNVLKNAIHYSFENSVVFIKTYKNNNSIIITFTNKGKVIPKDKLNTIFEKFYRLDTSRSSNTGGAGLGLAISKEIVNAHGGEISVKSDEFETVFVVNIPWAPN